MSGYPGCNPFEPKSTVLGEPEREGPCAGPDVRFVLDHGYVRLVETWGSDERIIEAARMSTGKGFQGWGPVECAYATQAEADRGGDNHASCPKCNGAGRVPGDEKLLRYLWEHEHLTPFEMAGMTVEIQAPIFVLREWHRHRTQSYNELSARYTELPDLFYAPSDERIKGGRQSRANKQGSGGGPFTDSEARWIKETMRKEYEDARWAYEDLIKAGVARELARLVIPVAQYSRMRASANLRNWLAFLRLRLAEGAQWEIRQYAGAVGKLVAAYFPRTWALFAEGVDAR